MADDQGARKRGKAQGNKGKGKAGKGGEGGKKKKKNPLLQEARSRYLEQIRGQGGSEEQIKEKVKAHMKSVVKPAMSEAKAGAEAKNLKGVERKKFVQDSVRAKLGLAGQ